MSNHFFQAKDLFGHRAGARAAAFKTALMSAMGHLAIQSRHVLIKDTLSSPPCGWVAFYPSDELIYKAPRVCVRFMRKCARTPARAIVEVGYHQAIHHRAPMQIEIQFPDDLQGLSGLMGDDEPIRYNGLFFNLTPGEYVANLYEAANSVCDAFEIAEALGAMAPVAA